MNFWYVSKIMVHLFRKGTSPKLMSAIRWRYILYFFLMLPFYIATAFTKFTLHGQIKLFDGDCQNLTIIMESVTLILGLSLALLRLFEPFVFYTFKDIYSEVK